MPMRTICLTKTGKQTKKKKNGACPKGAHKKTFRVKSRK